jgi:predicted RNase H-like HicB family nuclease
VSDHSPDTTVTVSPDDGWYVARDEQTGVASHGETRVEALANLADALELTGRRDASDEELSEPTAPWFD